MILYFDGMYKVGIGEFGHPLINTIDFINKRTGEIITIDRDESDASWEDDGTFSARWKGCYMWNGRGRNYDVSASDMMEYEPHNIDFDEYFTVSPDKSVVIITNYKFI